MSAISDRMPALVIDYDCRGKRISKEFQDAYLARRFYARKLKDGRNPKIRGKLTNLAAKSDKDSEHEQFTRPYAAGLVVKKFGIADGVTDEMVEAVDQLYGKVNPRESRFALRYAVQAIRAYTAS